MRIAVDGAAADDADAEEELDTVRATVVAAVTTVNVVVAAASFLPRQCLRLDQRAGG